MAFDESGWCLNISLRNPTSGKHPAEQGKRLPALSMSTFSRLQSAPTGFCRSRGVRKQDLQDIRHLPPACTPQAGFKHAKWGLSLQDVQDKRHLFAGRETLFILDILLRFLHLRWAQAIPT